MIIVSDTSPIINLAAIGHLQLLPDLFAEVIIPKAVYHEITILGAGEPGAQEIMNASWVKVVATSQVLLPKLFHELDPGEAEAIALALDLHADYILMDEATGRNIALSYNLQPLGVLGILLRAKQKQLVSLVCPLMDRLQSEANFFIDRNLYQHIRTAANE